MSLFASIHLTAELCTDDCSSSDEDSAGVQAPPASIESSTHRGAVDMTAGAVEAA